MTETKEVKIKEIRIIAVLAAVQFVNAFDFLMVMPLGPDFSKALGFSASTLGWIGGSYMVAASISGLVVSAFLDRFDRRTALIWCLVGLAIGTLLGGAATGFGSLMGARILAGIFGGPAAALTFSVAADVTTPERRGRAMGAVMSAFSIASIFGVPAGLELAHRGNWRLPFFAIGGLALAVLAIAFFELPSLRSHVERAKLDHPWRATRDLFRRREVVYAFGTMSIGMCASFLLIPNLATFLEFNLGFPRESLGALYLQGGLITVPFVLIAGRFVDQWTATVVSGVASLALISFIFTGMVDVPPALPLKVFFIGFMTAVSVRSVAGATIASRVPDAHERARFTSLLTVFQNAMAATGAITSSCILTSGADGKLDGMPTVAGLSIFVSLVVFGFVVILERLVKKNARAAVAA